MNLTKIPKEKCVICTFDDGQVTETPDGYVHIECLEDMNEPIKNLLAWEKGFMPDEDCQGCRENERENARGDFSGADDDFGRDR